MKEIALMLPLPPKELWPNARPNRYAKARAVKDYRRLAWALARQSIDQYAPPKWAEAETTATFYFATNRTRDRDNIAASLKAAYDGIADAGIVVNDAGLTHAPPEMRLDKDRPRVEITITPRAA